jgi:hypothetical protein
MKRLLIFFILFLIPSTIYAEEVYYSSYSDFSSWQETPVEADELTEVEIETRYRWYKNIRINDNYYLEGLNNPLFAHKDNEDYIETDWSEWSTTYPKNVLNRIIEEETIYRYRYMKDIRYIHIYDAYGSYGAFRIPEIKVYTGSYQLDYNVICTGCNSDFNDYIKNNNINENKSYINNGGHLIIDLKKEYGVDTIKIDIYLYDRGDDPKYFKIALTRENNTDSKQYLYKYNVLNFKSNEYEPNYYSYIPDESWVKDPAWDVYKTTKNKIQPTYYRQVTTYPQYRYKDKLYMYYKLERVYIDSFLLEAPDLNYLKDEESKINYYRYRKREKVVLPDDIVITDKDYNLLDYVDTTFAKDNIIINHNINIDKNGIYEVSYSLPFDDIVITKEVVVDIKENEIDINELEIKNNEVIKEFQIVSEEKQEVVSNNKYSTKVVDKKENNSSIIKEQKAPLINKKESSIAYHKKENTNKGSSLLSLNLYLYIYIILGIIVLIILFRKFFIKY